MRELLLLIAFRFVLIVTFTAVASGQTTTGVPTDYFQIRTYPFYNGFARIQVGDRFGFIDKNGRRVVALEYEAAKDFSQPIDKQGRRFACVKKDGKWVYIDQKGYQAINWQFDDADIFQVGLAAVGIGDIKSRKYGYIDPKGKVVLSPQYQQVGSFVEIDGIEGEAYATFQSEQKFGYLEYNVTTREIKEVVSAKYHQANRFSTDGFARVAVGRRYGYLSIQKIKDHQLKRLGQAQVADPLMAIPANYQQAYDTVDKLAVVQDRRKWSFLKVTSDSTSDYVPIKMGTATIENQLISQRSVDLDSVGHMSANLIRFGNYVGSTDNRMLYGFLAYQPETPALMVQIPSRFNYCGDFADGLARILIGGDLVDGKPTGGGLFGYINTEGQIHINPQFILAEDFSDGLAYVKKADNLGRIRRGYIDTNGDFKFEVGLDLAYDFFEDLAVFSLLKNTSQNAPRSLRRDQSESRDTTVKYGYVNRAGIAEIPAQFDKANNFQHGLACVLDSQGGKYGYIDSSGQHQIPAQFDQAYDFFQLESIGELESTDQLGTGRIDFVFKSSDMGRFVAEEKQYQTYFDLLDLNRDGQIEEKEYDRAKTFFSIQKGESDRVVELLHLVLNQNENADIESEEFFGFYDQNQNQQVDQAEYLAKIKVLQTAKSQSANQLGKMSTVNFPSFPPLALVEVNGEQFYINRSGQQINLPVESSSPTVPP